MVLKLPWSQKLIVINLWKWHFSDLCKFLIGNVDTLIRESEVKRWKLFKSKFGHRKYFRKWFWSYLDAKNEFFEQFKIAFLIFFTIFEVTELEPFSGKVKQSSQNCFNQSLVIRGILENDFKATLISKTNILNVWK